MADCKRRSRFKPCIDLHDGKVKQIVGGTLSDDDPGALRTNFVARLVRRLSSVNVTPSSPVNPQQILHVYIKSTTCKAGMS